MEAFSLDNQNFNEINVLLMFISFIKLYKQNISVCFWCLDKYNCGKVVKHINF